MHDAHSVQNILKWLNEFCLTRLACPRRAKHTDLVVFFVSAELTA